MADKLDSIYRQYYRVFEFIFCLCVVLFAGIALIRDCESTFRLNIVLNPVVLNCIFILNCVVLPLLAVVTLIFDYKDDNRTRLCAVLIIIVILFFQFNNDIKVYQSITEYLRVFFVPNSFERALWIYNIGSIYRPGIVFLAVSAKGKSFRKAAWAFVITQSVLMVIITALSLGGIIPDLVFAEIGRPERHSLGLHYPLNYAAHWFSISLVYCFIKNGILKIWDYSGLVLLLLVSIFVNKAQTSSILFTVLILVTLVRQFMIVHFKNSRLKRPDYINRVRSMALFCFKYSFVFFAAFMIVVSLMFTPAIRSFFDSVPVLNTFVSRFAFNRVGLLNYFPSILGVDYPISTWTGTVANEDYFFIDCSYVYELLHTGVIVFPIMMAVLWYIPHRLYKLKKGYALFILSLFACICTMEYHLADFSFNPFWLMAVAVLV